MQSLALGPRWPGSRRWRCCWPVSGRSGSARSFSGSGQGNVAITTTPNGYSYGIGSSQATAQKARRAAELASRDTERQAHLATTRSEDSNQEQATRSIFVNLKNAGYISVNKKCRVEFDSKRIKVDGKTVDNATFERIKSDFEAKLGKKAVHATIAFDGVITRLTNEDMDLTGQFSQSLSTD